MVLSVLVIDIAAHISYVHTFWPKQDPVAGDMAVRPAFMLWETQAELSIDHNILYM